jgi:hypothetical protein
MNVNNPSSNNVEKCKTVLSKQELIPLFSIRNIIGGTFMVVPWTILLLIVGIIIII